ncbi:MAG: ABC transporter permease subunit [Actinomycetota bacterium]
MSLIVQVLVSGLAAGAVYGLVAVGTSLAYRLTGVVPFALGDLVGLSVLVTLAVAGGTGPVTATNVSPVRYGLGLVAGLAVAVAAGLALYAFAVRPFLRRRSTIGWVGAMVAAAFAVHGFLAAAFVRDSYVFPDLLPFDRIGRGGAISVGGGATVQARAFLVIAVGVALAAGAVFVLRRSRHGLALQAVAMDLDAADAVGLPVDRLLALAFAGTGAIAALAAVLAAPGAPVSADTGALIGLKGLAAALLAGFGSPWRSFGGGLVVGLVEAGVVTLHVGALRLGAQWRDVAPLVLVVAVAVASGGRGRARRTRRARTAGRES